MAKLLNDLLDFDGIQRLVNSESANPEELLGAHIVDGSLVIQALIPHAKEVSVKLTKSEKLYPMTMINEAGYFAVVISRKTKTDYIFVVTFDGGETQEILDPYAEYPSQYTKDDFKKFAAGIHYDIYKKMGAHPKTVKGVSGVNFSVWAPCAKRVSVVGDFNMWDGRRHQMIRHGDSGIFELFIPGVKQGDLYRYEIKNSKGEPMMKSDPYGTYAELRPNTASIVWDIDNFEWSDGAWLKARTKESVKKKPMAIYELHLGSWIRKEIQINDEGKEIVGSEFYNYREIAPRLVKYLKEMGYTHVELLPVMEHPLDASWGYQVTGYYAPTSRYGTPDDFKYFMNYLHENGIGVLLDWVPAHFPRDAHGLAAFDGTCVYEHADPRQGAHPHWGTLIYNYGRPQVSNFLIANALYWVKEFHADGIRMDAVASMLYLDYGKNDGEWVANIYGGHENLEAVEFLKHLNSIMKKQNPGVMMIAEESTAWPKITGDLNDGGLGFDLKWNMGWMNDFTNYMKTDPFFRSHHHNELTFSMVYAYSEDFVLVFSHDEVVHGKCSMLLKMPGADYEAKANNLRAAYGFKYGHPGKKLLFMGQEFGQVAEWNENVELPWDILQYPVHEGIQKYVKDLNALYQSHPALYEKDYEPEGFQWIDCSNYKENIVVFIRKTEKPEETLLFVCNFAPVERENYTIGVPFVGKYKEILNSDKEIYGGTGKGNPRLKNSKPKEWNERPNSITIDIPPMSTLIFSCTPTAPKKTEKKAVGRKKAAEKNENILSEAVIEETDAVVIQHELVADEKKAEAVVQNVQSKTIADEKEPVVAENESVADEAEAAVVEMIQSEPAAEETKPTVVQSEKPAAKQKNNKKKRKGSKRKNK